MSRLMGGDLRLLVKRDDAKARVAEKRLSCHCEAQDPGPHDREIDRPGAGASIAEDIPRP